MRLGLGTVQFGMDYGISNRSGRTAEVEVGRILELAAESEVHILDTAPSYGSSEDILGSTLWPGHPFSIVTKVPRLNTDSTSSGEAVRTLRQTFEESLERLRQSKVYGLLFHDANDLLSPAGQDLFDSACGLRTEGLVAKVGVSVYSRAQIEGILSTCAIDLIQVPVSVFDQRLVRDGTLASLEERGVEIHARSVFLQGAVLMAPKDLPAHLAALRQPLESFVDWQRTEGLSSVQAALGFVCGLTEVEVVLCGANDAEQLQEIIEGAVSRNPSDYARFAVDDDGVLNPALWRQEREPGW